LATVEVISVFELNEKEVGEAEAPQVPLVTCSLPVATPVNFEAPPAAMGAATTASARIATAVAILAAWR